VSTVATMEKETTTSEDDVPATDPGMSAAEAAEAPGRAIRTAEQEQTVAEFLEMVDRMYAGADPRLIAALKDTEILNTEDLAGFLGYKRKTRVFQLYTDLRELADADQVPHPSAMPDVDTVLGHRGARNIRGVMRGRVVHWALQSGRFWWDFINGRLVPQEAINHGGAPRRS
jgi:hypothetical protein